MKQMIMAGAFLAGILLGINGYAQINLNKIKDKAKDKTKDAVQSGGKTDSGKDDGKMIDPSRAALEASPAKETIENYRDALSFAQDAVKGKYNDAGSRIEKLKEMLDKIKQQDPNWVEYNKDEAAYLELKKQYDIDQADAQIGKRIEDMSFGLSFVSSEPWRYENYAESMDKKKFEVLKKDVEGKNIGDYEKGQLVKLEKFYVEKGPEIKKHALSKLKEKKSETFLKANREKPEFMQNFHNYSHPESSLRTIDEAIKAANSALAFVPGDAELQQISKQLAADKTEVENYVSSGEYNKDVEKRKQMDIEERRIGKPLTVDASLDAVVKRDFDSKTFGTIKRISIITRDWKIEKNGLGLPLNKNKEVDIAVTQDGKCYKMTGFIICEYAGGGKYAAPKYSNHSGTQYEMNCANVNK